MARIDPLAYRAFRRGPAPEPVSDPTALLALAVEVEGLAALADWEPVGLDLENLTLSMRGEDGITGTTIRRLRRRAAAWAALSPDLREFFALSGKDWLTEIRQVADEQKELATLGLAVADVARAAAALPPELGYCNRGGREFFARHVRDHAGPRVVLLRAFGEADLPPGWAIGMTRRLFEAHAGHPCPYDLSHLLPRSKP